MILKVPAASPAMGELEIHTGRCPAQQQERLLVITDPQAGSNRSTELRAHSAWQFTTTFTAVTLHTETRMEGLQVTQCLLPSPAIGQ